MKYLLGVESNSQNWGDIPSNINASQHNALEIGTISLSEIKNAVWKCKYVYQIKTSSKTYFKFFSQMITFILFIYMYKYPTNERLFGNKKKMVHLLGFAQGELTPTEINVIYLM